MHRYDTEIRPGHDLRKIVQMRRIAFRQAVLDNVGQYMVDREGCTAEQDGRQADPVLIKVEVAGRLPIHAQRHIGSRESEQEYHIDEVEYAVMQAEERREHGLEDRTGAAELPTLQLTAVYRYRQRCQGYGHDTPHVDRPYQYAL